MLQSWTNFNILDGYNDLISKNYNDLYSLKFNISSNTQTWSLQQSNINNHFPRNSSYFGVFEQNGVWIGGW